MHALVDWLYEGLNIAKEVLDVLTRLLVFVWVAVGTVLLVGWLL